VYLLLEGAKLTADDKHLKTKTHNNNQNPEFNDVFRFKVSFSAF
jgi:hypothetical protein